MKKKLQSKKFVFVSMVLLVGYPIVANSDMELKVRKLLEEREKLRESSVEAPFPMPVIGDKYTIFQPIQDVSKGNSNVVPQLIAPAKDFVSTFKERIEFVDPMVQEKPAELKVSSMTSVEHARFMYFEMMKHFVSAVGYGQAELSVRPGLGVERFIISEFDREKRMVGMDWTYAGDTMVGWARLDNIKELIETVIREEVPGDYIETGKFEWQ